MKIDGAQKNTQHMLNTSSVTLNQIAWSLKLPHPQFTPDVPVFRFQSRCRADRIPF